MGCEEGAEDGHEGEEEEEEAADDALAVGPGFAPEGSVGVAGEYASLFQNCGHQSVTFLVFEYLLSNSHFAIYWGKSPSPRMTCSTI